MAAVVVSVNTSEKKGTCKTPVPEVLLTEAEGVAGDAHGGKWHRQVSLLAEESIDKMTALGAVGLTPGKFAENITTRGIILHTLPVGTRLRAGECLLEVTQIGKECHEHCEIHRQVGACIMPKEGIFAVVLRGGALRPGDGIETVPAADKA